MPGFDSKIKRGYIRILMGGMIILMLSMFGAIGCAKVEDIPKEVRITKEMLSEKYDETFEIKQVGQRWGAMINGTFKAIAHPTSDPSLIFEAIVDKEGTYIIDGYMTEIALKSIENLIQEKLMPDLSNVVIEVNTSTKTFDEVDLNITADTFISQKPNALYAVYLYLPTETFSKINATEFSETIVNVIKDVNLKNGNLFLIPADENQMQAIAAYQLEHVYHDMVFYDIIDESKELMVELKDGILLDLESKLSLFIENL